MFKMFYTSNQYDLLKIVKNIKERESLRGIFNNFFTSLKFSLNLTRSFAMIFFKKIINTLRFVRQFLKQETQ